jgi:UDP-N-acetyl-D-mannosaminuronic acid dehydrogenase
MGIDIFEVVRVANTHQGTTINPDGGGRYCLPNALFYLLPKGKS